ncbi:hypothetical protein ACFQFQ_29820 [Sulfitobacter porphyrae]|uniref:Uncharacterized protein n=1 Tax=Sulfitobacter porphyrae TaxID=1246864 RepID=A0ABW2BC57_9RHOB|nr:hypothetical protein GCM10007928_48820 [Sulfitobacter porphyrae]
MKSKVASVANIALAQTKWLGGPGAHRTVHVQSAMACGSLVGEGNITLVL